MPPKAFSPGKTIDLTDDDDEIISIQAAPSMLVNTPTASAPAEKGKDSLTGISESVPSIDQKNASANHQGQPATSGKRKAEDDGDQQKKKVLTDAEASKIKYSPDVSIEEATEFEKDGTIWKVMKGEDDTKIPSPYGKCPMMVKWRMSADSELLEMPSWIALLREKTSLNLWERDEKKYTDKNGKARWHDLRPDEPYLSIPTAEIVDVTPARDENELLLTQKLNDNSNWTLTLDFKASFNVPKHGHFLTALAPLGNNGQGTISHQDERNAKQAKETAREPHQKANTIRIRQEWQAHDMDDWKGITKTELREWVRWAKDFYADHTLRGLMNMKKHELQGQLIKWLQNTPTEGVDPAEQSRIPAPRIAARGPYNEVLSYHYTVEAANEAS